MCLHRYIKYYFIRNLERFLHCHFTSPSNNDRVVLCRLWDLRLIRQIFYIAIDGIKLFHDSCRTFLLSKNVFFLPWSLRLTYIKRTGMGSRLLASHKRYLTNLKRCSQLQNIKIIYFNENCFHKSCRK